MAIDWGFIRELEGFETSGYIPEDSDGNVAGKSGVTVGSGIDLGQMSESQIENLDISDSLKNTLKPYASKKEGKAVEFLDENPLELSEEQAKEVTTAIKKRDKRDVEKWYNKNNKEDNTFADLSDREQTVVASVGFQYGTSFKKTPSFAEGVLNGDWKAVTQELENFGDDYDTRRHKELQYLAGANVDGMLGPKTDKAVRGYVSSKQEDPNIFEESMSRREPALTPEMQSTQDYMRPFLDNMSQYIAQQLQSSTQGSQEGTEASSTPQQEGEGYTETEEALMSRMQDSLGKRPDHPIRTKEEADVDRAVNEKWLAEEASRAKAEEEESASEASGSKFTEAEEAILGKVQETEAGKRRRKEAAKKEESSTPTQMLF